MDLPWYPNVWKPFQEAFMYCVICRIKQSLELYNGLLSERILLSLIKFMAYLSICKTHIPLLQFRNPPNRNLDFKLTHFAEPIKFMTYLSIHTSSLGFNSNSAVVQTRIQTVSEHNLLILSKYMTSLSLLWKPYKGFKMANEYFQQKQNSVLSSPS